MYSLSHLSDRTLLRDLAAHVTKERGATAVVLAHIAEVEAREAYRAAGYSSMHAYCVGKLHFSEEAAYKRIHAARKARRFPAIFSAVADGRLHLSAVLLLASHLTDETAGDLLRAAEHKSKFEIQQLVAERFPRPDVATRIEAIPQQLVARPCETEFQVASLQPVAAEEHAPGRVDLGDRPRLTPLSPQRIAVKFTMSQDMHEKLVHAKDLLGHQLPSGDIVVVLDRALDALIEKLEKRKFGATENPRKSSRASRNPRQIPARVRRAVHERDGGRCTFVGENGHRCQARKFLEFDHVLEVARGGMSTVANVRLRCRTHNQFTAEQAYGPDFMKAKRDEAERVAAKRRAEEVVPWLQALGIRADHARRAAEQCENAPHATLEQRVTAALRHFGPRDVLLTRAAPA